MLKLPERALYPVLLFSVFVIAACGILYELLLGSVSSYFLGNSILQFSMTIGLFMFFMGIGSYSSKYIKTNLFEAFIFIEIVLGFIGGISATILHLVFAYTTHYLLYNILFIATLGALIGLEIPLVARIINKYSSLKETFAKVFSFDYIGALAASIVFPLVLLPVLGVVKTAFIIGLINISVALFNSIFFRKIFARSTFYIASSITLIIIFSAALLVSDKIDKTLEQKVYQDKIIFSEQTQYQKLVFTRWNEDYRLFINGAIQFSSIDEYRYHECLAHPAMLLSENREKILVLGGGDGLIVRELLKYDDVRKITLVDLDPEMTRIAKENVIFKSLNKNSLLDKRVEIVNEDAFNYISGSSEIFSTIIIDLPDPNDTGLGKLYSAEFYQMIRKRLDTMGIVVTQATSPYFSREAFWCINNTMESVFSVTIPMQTNVPSFGIWGFVLSGKSLNRFLKNDTLPFSEIIRTKIADKTRKFPRLKTLKYFDSDKISLLLHFDKDMGEIPTEINVLSTQKLVQYYTQSADNWR